MSSSSSSSASSRSSSTSRSSSSDIYPASGVKASLHSAELLQMVELELSSQIIAYLVDRVSETVEFAMHHTASSNPKKSRPHFKRDPKFVTFASNVITRAEVTTPAVLTALVYLDRARPHLQISTNEWACERVFLGAIILASKYLNDSTLKNSHWAMCTGIFGKRDIARVEREFLDVLDFELQVSESDLMSHHAGLWAFLASTTMPSLESLRISIPPLEPSSPGTSDGTSSPRTPTTPSYVPIGVKHRGDDDDHHHHHHTLRHHRQKFHDLLKSFPVPPVPRLHLHSYVQ